MMAEMWMIRKTGSHHPNTSRRVQSTSLANRAGEYATLFFSQGTRDEYERDSRAATEQRTLAGLRVISTRKWSGVVE